MTKQIIFACSSGIATSTVVAEKVEEYCREKGVDVNARQGTVGELSGLDGVVDLFVVTSDVGSGYNTPVVNALPILTGIGEEEVLEQIVAILRDSE
ncbi:PTS sugar transporter subunit IIB [Corticicoccus populi]|uniref:PTS sugar transporter subunit IIB n=1 Tax=Corticicoccus populi TaxID=1812821 RepID=A0ABW5WVP2_9STAP